MRLTQLRQADLNLLVVFTVLAEERSVSRAAPRLLLSQPAVSRALQRLRAMFHDELLVRTPSGYEATPQGQRLLQELEVMLPRLDRLLTGSPFDPATEEATFRIMATDNASLSLCPLLSRVVLPRAGGITFDITAWHEGGFEALERGRLDLLLNADDGYMPSQFSTEVLYEEDFVCVVAKESRYPRQLTLKQYLQASHIGVTILGGMQTIPEKRLGDLGLKRHLAMRVPYFSAAIRSVAGTQLIATVPRRLADHEAQNPALKVIKAPPEMTGFKYLMAWHPRVDSDAAHGWLRATMRELGKTLSLA
jgi:DNA-binding transcriptional LysR family regulator